MTESRLRHDGVTIACPVCGDNFVASGRKAYCGDACKAKAYRRRRNARPTPTIVVPPGRPRRAISVYECPACGIRAVGEQRCACGCFMARVGFGGHCPHCEEAVAVSDLLGEEVTFLA